jgi:hypothetical protein
VYSTEGYSGGVNLVVVGPMGLTGEIEGIIEVPDWAVNKSTRFPTGKAGEGVIPATFGNRGEELVQVQIPDYDPSDASPLWFEIGATNNRRLKLPTRMSKAIPSGLTSAEWVKPGRTEIGELTIDAANLGHEEGLLKIAGMNCTIMLKVLSEGVLETARIFILDWTPTIERSDPEGDGESTVSATGMFSRFAVITADGTPAGGS